MNVFVTVGTTSFDDLVRAVDSDEVLLDALIDAGVERLAIQHGRGDYAVVDRVHVRDDGKHLEIRGFRFAPSLGTFIDAADYVVSHAGAGSVLEALRAEKRLLVVVNASLQDNHQMELGSAMEKQNYLYCCASPSELRHDLRSFLRRNPGETSSFAPYPARDAKAFSKLVDATML